MRTTLSILPSMILLALLAATALTVPARAQDEAFPLRAIYPEVAHISTEDLLARYDQAVIVDIRSRFEYEVAHVNKAALLPMTRPDFPQALAELRGPDGPEPLVFYCNGHTCAKSYQAARMALSLGFANVFAFDGGIFDWIQAAPDKATLMGRTPADGAGVIPHGRFIARLLPFAEFKARGLEAGAVFIDIRDPFQREVIPDLPGVKNIPLDPLLEMITTHVWTEKPLYFFDAVGKQVRWLQYFLESCGYYDYAFLYGGVREIADDPELVRAGTEDTGSVRVFQERLARAALDPKLTGTDVKLLALLMAHLKFNNYAALDVNETASALNLDPAALRAGLDRLQQGGWLTHRALDQTIIFQIDPRLAWKGDAETGLWEPGETEDAPKAGEADQ